MKRVLALAVTLLTVTEGNAGEARAMDAVKQFHRGMTSPDKEVNRATLQRYLPTKEDLVYLFGEDGRLIADVFDRKGTLRRLVNDAGTMSDKLRRKGGIRSLSLERVHTGNQRYRYFIDELEALPSDVAVYIPHVEYKHISGGPFHARVVLMPCKELLIVGFERYLDSARELKAKPNTSTATH